MSIINKGLSLVIALQYKGLYHIMLLTGYFCISQGIDWNKLYWARDSANLD